MFANKKEPTKDVSNYFRNANYSGKETALQEYGKENATPSSDTLAAAHTISSFFGIIVLNLRKTSVVFPLSI